MYEKYYKPSRLGVWLIRKFSEGDRNYGFLGDVSEMYNIRRAENGAFRTRLWFFSEVLKSIMLGLRDSFFHGAVMFRSYIKTSFRNLLRNKLYTAINIFGLATAVGWCILAYVNYEYGDSFDAFHPNAKNIYKINSKIFANNQLDNWSIVPTPLMKNMQNISGVNRTVRLERSSGILRFEDRVFNERVYFADNGFFSVFNFSVKYGSTAEFGDLASIIIDEEIALKYFGRENPVGKQMTLDFGAQRRYHLSVSAVLEDVPTRSSMQFRIVLPFELLQNLDAYGDEDWQSWVRVAFVETEDGVSQEQIESQLQESIRIQNTANQDQKVEAFFLTPLRDVAKVELTLRRGFLRNSMPTSAKLSPTFTATFILLLAIFNFVNTAIANASRRLREIGVRKVLGGLRKQLMVQFFSENLLLCFLSLVTGLFFGAVFVKIYEGIWPQFDLSFTYLDNVEFILFLSGLLVFTAIAAGVYPSVYISRFNPIAIFKGKQKLVTKNKLKNTLLLFQFSIAILGFISTSIVYQNSVYQKNYYVGYDNANLIVVPLRGASSYELYKNVISDNAAVIDIGASNHVTRWSWNNGILKYGSENITINMMEIGENYFETLRFSMIDGDSFDWSLDAKTDNSILVNETMLTYLELRNPVGKTVKIDEKEYIIRGVIKDFHYQFFITEIRPMVLKRSLPAQYNNISVRYTAGSGESMLTYLETEWKRLFPDAPFNGYYQDEQHVRDLHINDQVIDLTLFQAISSVIVTCMGLFAIASLTIDAKIKEIGIRKVIGASVGGLSFLITRNFVLLLIAASVLASIGGHYMMKIGLDLVFPYHVGFSILPFIFSSFVVLVFSFLTIGYQVFKAAMANPVNSLRYE